jgi:hypothetical protein
MVLNPLFPLKAGGSPSGIFLCADRIEDRLLDCDRTRFHGLRADGIGRDLAKAEANTDGAAQRTDCPEGRLRVAGPADRPVGLALEF